MNEPRDTIIKLLEAGHEHVARYKEYGPDALPQMSEMWARQAVGYFQAAAALLNGFPELHNSLIEHPLFVAGRSFQRRFQF